MTHNFDTIFMVILIATQMTPSHPTAVNHFVVALLFSYSHHPPGSSTGHFSKPVNFCCYPYQSFCYQCGCSPKHITTICSGKGK